MGVLRIVWQPALHEAMEGGSDMTADQIAALFTRADGQFLCARWGRPIVPVVFGVDDATLGTIKGAFEAVCALAGHHMSDMDPELGANLMLFFVRDWDELAAVPDLDRLIPDLVPLLARLKAADANQYRIFRFDAAGAIRACFAFVRMDDQMAQVPAQVLALNQAVQVIVLWSDRAFTDRSPMVKTGADAGGNIFLRPEIGAVIRAVYDPVLPAMARDASHALRLAERIGRGA